MSTRTTSPDKVHHNCEDDNNDTNHTQMSFASSQSLSGNNNDVDNDEASFMNDGTDMDMNMDMDMDMNMDISDQVTSMKIKYPEKSRHTARTSSSTTTTSASSSLMSLFSSPQQNEKQENDQVRLVQQQTKCESTYGSENNDYDFSFEPLVQRRKTEVMSNSINNGGSIYVESGSSSTKKNYTDTIKPDVETDYLLKDIPIKMNRDDHSPVNATTTSFLNILQSEDDSIEKKSQNLKPPSPLWESISWQSIKATISGSVMFILFHILFCLAQASAIHRPHSSKSILGPMTRMSALGPIVAGPLYVYILGDQFPALYPTIDAFPAPFLVQQAAIVDDMLYSRGLEDDDELFMTTFCVLSGLGLIFTGMFLYIGTKFKLANLGAYLPYPVLAGFFSTVGFLGWTLAFSVDTGKNIGEVITDGDWNETKRCLLHHFPSVIVGVSISVFVSGPRKSWTPVFVLGTIPIVFAIMFLTGTSLDEARQLGWFWKKEEFESVADGSFDNFQHNDGFSWSPPLPFGVIIGVLRGKVYLPALIKGLPVSFAMGLMYLLRCSLHVPALQKNSETLLKWHEDQKLYHHATRSVLNVIEIKDTSQRRLRSFSEESCYNHDENEVESSQVGKSSRQKTYSIADTYIWYANCLVFSGLAGGSATIPSMGASITLFKIGARGKAPQYGSVVLLVFFYLNKFELVGYIPRIVFSTLLFVSSMDLLHNWFILSYQKTADKGEWLIVPILSLFAFVVGVLPAVALGLALSTFIFVGAFYRSGVVKFIGTGKTVHSTTERNIDDAEWLDDNGDLIQVMVLQNYLFFGNANSVKNYATTMFEKVEKTLENSVPPFPKYLIIDMSLVTGTDTSAVEIFSDIVSLCHGNKCQVFLAGLTPRLKYIMKRGGVTHSSDKMSKFSILRLPPTMESALMKAEDGLLKFVFKTEEREMQHVRERSLSIDNDGFLHALTLIDLKHGTKIASKLNDLRPYTSVVTLVAGESLFHNPDGSINERERGLFFIEHGIIRVESDTFATNTRTGNTLKSIITTDASSNLAAFGSLTNLRASAICENLEEKERNVRIARFGSGWVVGTLEGLSQIHYSGIHIAVTPCRLYHLPYEVIPMLERNDPALILQLFKMMSLITARRQEATISQLTTLQAIMSAPSPLYPIRKNKKLR